MLTGVRPATLAPLLLAVGGCYGWRPVDGPEPQPGARVAVTLTDSGSSALAEYVGQSVTIVEGRLVATSATDLVISVAAVRDRSGAQNPWTGEQATLPRRLVASLADRRFMLGRSAAVVAGSVAGTLAVFRAFGVGGGTGASHMPPPITR